MFLVTFYLLLLLFFFTSLLVYFPLVEIQTLLIFSSKIVIDFCLTYTFLFFHSLRLQLKLLKFYISFIHFFPYLLWESLTQIMQIVLQSNSTIFIPFQKIFPCLLSLFLTFEPCLHIPLSEIFQLFLSLLIQLLFLDQTKLTNFISS